MCVDCYEYIVDPLGTASVSWTNCDGSDGSGTFTEPTIIPCAQEGSVLNEGGDPIITQGTYCGNSCVPPPTTTTTSSSTSTSTSTSSSTTTTTTTVCPDCFNYTVEPLGEAGISWTSCDGITNSSVFSEPTIICAQENSVILTSGDATITQGSYCGNPCITTTTTTTLVCDDCYSYTVTADVSATIQWINCNGTAGEAVLSDPTPYEIPCAVENSIVIISGTATIAIGTLCGNTCPTTTTTTTGSPTTTTTTTLPQCLYYNLFASNKGPVTFEYIVCDQTSVTTTTVPASTNISVCAETSYGIVITSGSLNGGFTVLGDCP